MTDPSFSKTRFFNLMRYTWTLLAVWTAILAGLLTKEFVDIKRYTTEIALNTARAHLNKDTSFRLWGSMHGGVYVPTLEDIQPNPYLAHFPERGTSSPPPRPAPDPDEPGVHCSLFFLACPPRLLVACDVPTVVDLRQTASGYLILMETHMMMKLLTKYWTTLPLALLVLIGLLSAGGLALAGDKENFDVTKIYASHGEAKAQYELGLMYATGRGALQDLPQAAIWYRKAAEQGHTEAQYQLGSMYDTGKGLAQNFTEAVFWYNEATDHGHPTSKLNSDKIRKHVDSLQNSAEQGVADAQVTLGKMYSDGNGVPQNDGQAFAWFRKAAEQGNAAAQCHFGFSYAEGKGIAKDYDQAVAWYRKAAEQGNAEAQYKLGSMYHKGRGVPQSGVDAFAWLSLAATQGYDVAVANKGFALSRLTPEEQTKAQTLAAELQAMVDSKKP